MKFYCFSLLIICCYLSNLASGSNKTTFTPTLFNDSSPQHNLYGVLSLVLLRLHEVHEIGTVFLPCELNLDQNLGRIFSRWIIPCTTFCGGNAVNNCFVRKILNLLDSIRLLLQMGKLDLLGKLNDTDLYL